MSGRARTPCTGCLRLFRGLAVPSEHAEAVKADIRTNGLEADRGHWRMIWDPPGEDAVSDDEELLAVCACGDFDSAAYYAYRHNRSRANDTPLVIEFEADTVAVDGRDFLYTVFQLGNGEKARGVVGQAFGRRALTYLDDAWGAAEQSHRISYCREACHDPDVVRAHHANQLVLGGRYATRFRSAFLVKAPVAAALVTKIHWLESGWSLPVPDVDLYDMLDRQRWSAE